MARLLGPQKSILYGTTFAKPEMPKNVKKFSWIKKRCSESSRAKSQQRQRRKSGLFKKAAEFSLECESDVVVAIRIRKTGQAYIFDSSSQETPELGTHRNSAILYYLTHTLGIFLSPSNSSDN